MWKREKSVVLDESFRQGLAEVKRLVSILNKFPLLEFIPVSYDSVPEMICNVLSSEGPRDEYKRLVLARYVFSGNCKVDVCLGLLAGKDFRSWHLVEAKIEWHERMLGVAGNDPVVIMLEMSQISMLFSMDQLRRQYDSKILVGENEMAEYEYYKTRSDEIIGIATREMVERLGGFDVPLRLGSIDSGRYQ